MKLFPQGIYNAQFSSYGTPDASDMCFSSIRVERSHCFVTKYYLLKSFPSIPFLFPTVHLPTTRKVCFSVINFRKCPFLRRT